MLVLSNECGPVSQNGRDIAAYIIPSPSEMMIKSINHAMNLSIQLASTIVSVSVVVVVVPDDDDDDDKLVSGLGVLFLLSNISTMTPAIKTRMPAILRML